jgi:hypothetical protein
VAASSGFKPFIVPTLPAFRKEPFRQVLWRRVDARLRMAKEKVCSFRIISEAETGKSYIFIYNVSS